MLQDINQHINEGKDWREDEYLVGGIERFLNERFGGFISERQNKGDIEGVKYYKERLKNLLEDLRRR